MTDLPKISIITPSFNQGQFLEETINSVINQHYPNLEYMIMDGGSMDGSIEIIKKYENHLSYWVSEPDAGQYYVINQGLSRATGDIMAWINSDDKHLPWTLGTIASVMSELPQVQWLTTLRPAFWDWHGFCTHIETISGLSKEAFLDGRYGPDQASTSMVVLNSGEWIQQESTFWRRELWEAVGGLLPQKYPLAADFDLWSRFYQHADLYGLVAPLAGFRHQENQRSMDKAAYFSEAANSLAVMRKSENWSLKRSRKLSRMLSLNNIPKVRHFTRALYAYTGKVIYRELDGSPNAKWCIREQPFF